jgi:NAD+ kinase
MARFDVQVNDIPFTTVQGDGILISTPTGSTAYNLSCGGSIVHPSADVICLTSICPLSLSFRPVILPKQDVIKIIVPEMARTNAWVTIDG